MGTAPQIEPARVVRCLLPQRPAAAAARPSASRRRPSSCHVHEPSRGRNRAQGLNYARTCLRQHVANDPRSRRCDTTRAEGVQAAERRVLVGESVLHREPPRCIRLSLRFASGAVRRQSSTDHAGQHIQCHARPSEGHGNRRLGAAKDGSHRSCNCRTPATGQIAAAASTRLQPSSSRSLPARLAGARPDVNFQAWTCTNTITAQGSETPEPADAAHSVVPTAARRPLAASGGFDLSAGA
jgi:hypothetical protein